MSKLNELKCVACRSKEPTLSDLEIIEYLTEIPSWLVREVNGIKHLSRIYNFSNFIQALKFTNQVGEIAEQEDHHPTLVTEWGRVTVDWWTHKIGGLHKNDFIMAAKTDKLIVSVH